VVTKSIILSSVILLAACANGVDEEFVDGPSESTEAKVPTTKSSTLADAPAAGDPSLRRDDPATTFVPILNWSFESASADCNGWPLLGATSSIRAVPSRSGEYSCKVCANGSGPDVALGQNLGKVAKGHYILSAFVRSRAKTAAPGAALARVEAVHATGLITVAVAPTVAVREEWDRVQTVVDLTEDADNVTIAIGAPDAAPDTCLFVDDVTFTRSE